MTRSLLAAALLLLSTELFAQSASAPSFPDRFEIVPYQPVAVPEYYRESFLFNDGQGEDSAREEYPDPTRVLYRSMMVPGWGQVINRQAWKVPLIYGLFVGLGFYNHELNRRYQGYRAAYYNQTQGPDGDMQFGPTPDFISPDATSEQLRQQRDRFRNQRDLSYVFFVLAYGLNILDAYVYAHMRSFDVSDDLSASASFHPELFGNGGAGLTLQVRLGSGRSVP